MYQPGSPFAVWDGSSEGADLIAGLNLEDPAWFRASTTRPRRPHKGR